MLCGETDIAAVDIRISINQMKRNVTGETITGFEKQFEILSQNAPSLIFSN